MIEQETIGNDGYTSGTNEGTDGEPGVEQELSLIHI